MIDLKRLTRILAYLVVGLLLLLVLLLLAGNLYANSSHFKGRLRAAVETNLGLSPHFSHLSITPWFGLVLHGVGARPNEDEGKPPADPATITEGGAFAGAKKITIRPRYLTLLSREIEIAEIEVKGASLDCLRTAEGLLVLPLPLRKTRVERRPQPQVVPPVIPRPPVPIPTSPPDESEDQDEGSKSSPKPPPPKNAAGTPPPTPEPKNSPPPMPQPRPQAPVVEVAPTAKTNLPHGVFLHQLNRRIGLARVKLSEGGIRLFAEGIRQPLLEISQYSLDMDLEESSSGILSVHEFSILGVPMAQGFRADVELTEGGELRIREIDASILQGQARGTSALLINRPGIPFQGTFVGKGLSLEQLGDELARAGNFPLSPDRGEAHFQLSAQGLTQIPESVDLAVKGHASNVEVKEIRALLPAIQAVAGGRSHLLEDALVGDLSFDVRIARGAIQLNDFRAGSRHLILRGYGMVAPGGNVRILGRLYATKEGQGFFRDMEKDLPEEERTTFKQMEHTSWGYRDLQIHGNLRQPIGDFLQPGRFITIQDAMAEIRERVEK